MPETDKSPEQTSEKTKKATFTSAEEAESFLKEHLRGKSPPARASRAEHNRDAGDRVIRVLFEAREYKLVRPTAKAFGMEKGRLEELAEKEITTLSEENHRLSSKIGPMADIAMGLKSERLRKRALEILTPLLIQRLFSGSGYYDSTEASVNNATDMCNSFRFTLEERVSFLKTALDVYKSNRSEAKRTKVAALFKGIKLPLEVKQQIGIDVFNAEMPPNGIGLSLARVALEISEVTEEKKMRLAMEKVAQMLDERLPGTAAKIITEFEIPKARVARAAFLRETETK
jgi:hypothetical protein